MDALESYYMRYVYGRDAYGAGDVITDEDRLRTIKTNLKKSSNLDRIFVEFAAHFKDLSKRNKKEKK